MNPMPHQRMLQILQSITTQRTAVIGFFGGQINTQQYLEYKVKSTAANWPTDIRSDFDNALTPQEKNSAYYALDLMNFTTLFASSSVHLVP